MKDRQIENLKILKEILDKIIDNPELRFIQILWALGIVDREDRFYEEPSVTLERVRKIVGRSESA